MKFEKKHHQTLAEGDVCIPAQENAGFVCQMEEMLEVYHRAPKPNHPVVSMNETSVQCVTEVREPMPARPGQHERCDVEYERNGVAHYCCFARRSIIGAHLTLLITTQRCSGRRHSTGGPRGLP